jgi:NTE family protein
LIFIGESIKVSKAFVLSGGGAKGAFQVGALKFLMMDSGIKPDFVVGTSTGALNALGISHIGIEGTEKVWRSIKSQGDILSSNWWKLWNSGYYSTKPLRKIVDQVSRNPNQLQAHVCYLDMNDGSVHYACNEDMGSLEFANYVEASCIMPVIMEPFQGHLVDGGLREVAPLSKAVELGAETIYLIVTSPLTESVGSPFNRTFPAIYSDLGRAIDIMSHEIYMKDIQMCQERNENPSFRRIDLKVIAPLQNLIDTLEFDPVKIAQAIDVGYSVAKGCLS